MNTPVISLIAAIGKNRELGRNNELLFDISEDMRHFRDTTRGHAVIMGRKTYESIGRPLPQRINIVISRSTNLELPVDVKIASSIEEAIEMAKSLGEEEIFVIGGAQIYEIALPYADKLYLTLVDKSVSDADAYFPEFADFKEFSRRKSSNDNYSYEFVEFEREK